MSGISDTQRTAGGRVQPPTRVSGQGDAAAAAATPPVPGAKGRMPGAEDGALPPQRGAPTRIGLPAVAPASAAKPGGEPVPPYGETFGGKSYVKDGSDPAMLKLMARAVAADPQLANSDLAKNVAAGKVGADDVKALQRHLESKGYSVGSKGVDGKFGPDTHAALAGLLTGAPPKAPAGNDVKPPGQDPKVPEVKKPPAGTEPGTAVYDVSSATVTLPDGTVLEAHSGRGAAQDDPNSSNLRNRGTTPAGLYKLTPREARFHGVAALRLTPISGNQHGRDGFLAHSYMLGPRGESHGCVVFKSYPAFLKAYNSGQINQIRIVP